MREQDASGKPPVRVIDLDQFEAELRESLEEAPSSANDIYGNAFRQLRLIDPAGTIEDSQIGTLLDEVAAYYAPSTKSVTIMVTSKGGWPRSSRP